ncbi:hypothetical protein [Rubrivivax gelatinosus]|uniref:hypothetical protein n=1 Tax=Rubrivivax gelatinosus TaxID=28068 RepID=UPI0013893EDC|nr:hypothetical protein [Rubrivivax gelatinosus]MBG6083148.1 hypothetical protein [Rubrivivax gelatinosus]
MDALLSSGLSSGEVAAGVVAELLPPYQVPHWNPARAAAVTALACLLDASPARCAIELTRVMRGALLARRMHAQDIAVLYSPLFAAVCARRARDRQNTAGTREPV